VSKSLIQPGAGSYRRVVVFIVLNFDVLPFKVDYLKAKKSLGNRVSIRKSKTKQKLCPYQFKILSLK